MKKLLSMLLAALVLISGTAAFAAVGDPGTSSIKVLGSNGSVTVGMRTNYGKDIVMGYWPDGQAQTMSGDKREFVYTTDGVHWKAGEYDGELEGAYRGYYAGGRFWVYGSYVFGPDYCSTDGVHWTEADTYGADFYDYPRGTADLGPYHFELDDWGNLWVMEGNDASYGARIPGVREDQERRGLNYNDIYAYYGPNDTVTLEIYDFFDFDGTKKYTASYAASSLDWVLENQLEYRQDTMTSHTDNGSDVFLAVKPVGDSTAEGRHCYLVIGDGSYVNWTRVEGVPFNGPMKLFPFNGKTFIVQNHHTLYASEDGKTWRSLRDTDLYPRVDSPEQMVHLYDNYGIVWTGSEYLTCMDVGEGHYGMQGVSGGTWYSPDNTKAVFFNESFERTGEHDFGNQVESVGYWNATYCAVVNQEGQKVLYLSKDKVNWKRTDYIALLESLTSVRGDYSVDW